MYETFRISADGKPKPSGTFLGTAEEHASNARRRADNYHAAKRDLDELKEVWDE